MISAKDAVQAAIDFLQGFFPEAAGIRLEEIEVEEFSTNWCVVLSFKTGEPTTLAAVMGGDARLYKTVKVDGTTAQPISLKIWNK